MRNEQDGSEQERELLELLSQSALNDYPNPDRNGCPGEAFLKQLATNQKSIPLRDPRLDHVVHCSPCFREFVAFRGAAVTKSKRVNRVLSLSIGVAAILLVGIGLWFFTATHGSTQGPASKPLVAEISLQDRAIVRGTPKQQGQTQELRIPRGNLQLTVLLPFGSEPGKYEVQILRDVNEPLISGVGNADIVNGAIKLEVPLNTSPLNAGKYLLGVRQPSLDWTFNPILVQ